jgi:hypothetical protein
VVVDLLSQRRLELHAKPVVFQLRFVLMLKIDWWPFTRSAGLMRRNMLIVTALQLAVEGL